MKTFRFGKKVWLRLALAALVLGLVDVAVVPRPLDVELSRVQQGIFHERIRSDGFLRSKDRYIVPAFADGDIRRVDLKVGDSVKKGQVITELFWDVNWDPLRSPITGVVSKLYRESAGPIRRGEPIIEVVDPSKLEAVAELLTTDALRVSPGDAVEITNWGLEGALSARVARVSRAGFTKLSALGVEEERTEVIMDLLRPPPELISRFGNDFHVEVLIEVASVSDALLLPVGALFREGAGWAVYRVEGGRARRAGVEIGPRSEQVAQVLSGVRRGDEVILFPGERVREGSRVRAGKG